MYINIYTCKWVYDINQSMIKATYRLRAIEPCLPSDSRNDESAVSKRVIISHDLFNSASTKKPLRRSVILFSVAARLPKFLCIRVGNFPKNLFVCDHLYFCVSYNPLKSNHYAEANGTRVIRSFHGTASSWMNDLFFLWFHTILLYTYSDSRR